MNFLQKIFSIRNERTHKVITIMGLKIKFKSFHKIIADQISYCCAREIYSALEVAKQHTEVFKEFKNCHHNKSILIIGCGPSVQFYNNEIHDDTIKIALNDAIFFDKFYFDYLFNWDTGVLITNKNWYIDVNKYNCKKFYGSCVTGICDYPYEKYDDNQNNIYHFYYSARHGWPAFDFGDIINKDITTYPLVDFGSISFGALHFALWTHPQKIYLIGLDSSNNGHVLGKKYEGTYPIKRMLDGYKKFKKFKNLHYSDVEIISVNPVGLRGFFKDVYTQSYLDEHTELKTSDVEIINENIINA